jgi:hypothetical protein
MRTPLFFPSDSPALAVFLAASSLTLLGCDQGNPVAATSPAEASFSSGNPRAAVVIRNAGCGLFDGSGEIVFADRDISILTQSTRQNTTLICKVKNVANVTGRAVNYDSENNPLFSGLLCGTFRGPTTDWTETVSASGNATLRCHFKGAPADSGSVS